MVQIGESNYSYSDFNGIDCRIVVTVPWQEYYTWLVDVVMVATSVGFGAVLLLLLWLGRCIWVGKPQPESVFPVITVIIGTLWALWVVQTKKNTNELIMDALADQTTL